MRSVALLAPSASLTSAAATLDLQDAVLSEVELEFDSFVPHVAARYGLRCSNLSRCQAVPPGRVLDVSFALRIAVHVAPL